jgi:hypothetical protein
VVRGVIIVNVKMILREKRYAYLNSLPKVAAAKN